MKALAFAMRLSCAVCVHALVTRPFTMYAVEVVLMCDLRRNTNTLPPKNNCVPPSRPQVCELARLAGASHVAFDWEEAARNQPAAAFLWAMAEEAAAAEQAEEEGEGAQAAVPGARAAGAQGAQGAAERPNAEQPLSKTAAVPLPAGAGAGAASPPRAFFVPGTAALATAHDLAPDDELCASGRGGAGGGAAEEAARLARQEEEEEEARARAADALPLRSAREVAGRLAAIVRLWHAPGGPGWPAPAPAQLAQGVPHGADGRATTTTAARRSRPPRWPSAAEVRLLLAEPTAVQTVEAALEVGGHAGGADRAARSAGGAAPATGRTWPPQAPAAAPAAALVAGGQAPASAPACNDASGAQGDAAMTGARKAKANGARVLARLLKAAARCSAAAAAAHKGPAAASAARLLRGSHADAAAQGAPLEDQLRARLTGALCRHALAGQPCRYEDCPYDHALGRRAAGRAGSESGAAAAARAAAGAGAGSGAPPDPCGPSTLAACPAPASAPASAPPSATSAEPQPAQGRQPTADATAAVAAFNRADRGVSVYLNVHAGLRPAAGQLFVPLRAAERCANSLRFIGQAPPRQAEGEAAEGEGQAGQRAGQQAGLQPPVDGGREASVGARAPFDHGPRTFALHDATTDAIALGLSRHPQAVHAFVLGRCRGLGSLRVPAPFARAWQEALALDRAALGGAGVPRGADASPAADGDAAEGARQAGGEKEARAPLHDGQRAAKPAEPARDAHAHLRREIRHGLQVMMQEGNPHSYYAQVEHHFS